MSSDKVDEILAQWLAVRPDLDCSAMGVVGRLNRTSAVWKKTLDPVFREYGLSSIEFDILATMRRSDTAVTPTELYHTLMLSSGAVSTRIEQLVKSGFVQRIASEEDRRSCKVTLTKKGIELVDTALNAHVANMDNMLSVLSNKEQEQLANLLRKILLAEQ
ncbi:MULTISPECIES: MarR family transcriptional regulator [unclassified Photobacterium]|uniref:MarR family winged helix-turn-helix transcriptional regulator n=1 Tax=unclassified Photobacterium TaxID=2628852 RepID=UPI001EDE688F|nr:MULTISPECIES: MarR family transcriptional regulator [unclassified Photobacterium]MCG3862885.1 MarR family transcriptional regulator [Photobacterium sp. Ph6]MCG3874416.1 MarR family transcriptional regulator [Photobacterium sp. Ph5]